ncbi:hypothetical protein PInf_028247 [Phytophthora infestans]|nr:hypothetical protein PInf_028247 [Phytophthora infestans]
MTDWIDLKEFKRFPIAIEDTNAGGGVASFEEELKTDEKPGLEACDRDDDEPDDVNIGDESFLCSAESNDEVSVFDEHKIDDEEYVDDVESDPQFEDASQNYRHDSREMRERASSGWELYDQDRCADLKLDGATLFDVIVEENCVGV